MNGCVDIHILFDVGAVGDHDTHGNTEGEEDLAHGVQKDLKKAPQCQSCKVRFQIYDQSLQTCACNARVIRVTEGQGEDRDRDDHNKHDRHQDP